MTQLSIPRWFAPALGFLLYSAFATAQDAKPDRLKWHDSYAAAKAEAAATGKPIFLEFRCAP